MRFEAGETLILDYGKAGTDRLLGNLSGIAVAGDFLWTVSDEGRSVECLRADGEGWVLHDQVRLDDVVGHIPDADEEAEIDLESVHVSDGFLWLAGSHCRVRKKPDEDHPLNPALRTRKSRNFLASIELTDGGGKLGKARRLPFSGKNGLRTELLEDAYLKPFRKLPSKENGLDIEGLAILGDEVLLGLRGPVIDSFAVVVHLRLTARFRIGRHRLSFLDLDGLGIRDLALDGDTVLVLAGPVSDALGPFRLYRWRPAEIRNIQTPEPEGQWPEGALEKPEGLCALDRAGARGLAVVYDSPIEAKRISGVRYRADWFRLW